MKKVVLILAALTLALLASTALAETFTHPETGEQINFNFRDGRPIIALYDKFMYDMHEDETPMRGLQLTEDLNVAQSVDKVFTSLDQDLKNGDIVNYSVFGLEEMVPKEVMDEINAMDTKDRVLAYMYLLGYSESLEAYDDYMTENAKAMLTKLEGLAADGTINFENWRYDNKGVTTLDGMVYDWNMFIMEVEYGDGSKMYECYGFIYYGDEWHLQRLTLTVLDNVAGPGAAVLANAGEGEAEGFYDDQALRTVDWTLPPEEVASLEGATTVDNRVIVPDVKLYELDAELEYVYAGEEMLARQFTMDSGSNETFGSLFVSALLRYGDPTSTTDRSVTWEFDDVIIIIENTDKLSITYYPNYGTEEVW